MSGLSLVFIFMEKKLITILVLRVLSIPLAAILSMVAIQVINTAFFDGNWGNTVLFLLLIVIPYCLIEAAIEFIK